MHAILKSFTRRQLIVITISLSLSAFFAVLGVRAEHASAEAAPVATVAID